MSDNILFPISVIGLLLSVLAVTLVLVYGGDLKQQKQEVEVSIKELAAGQQLLFRIIFDRPPEK
jgi:hypothetical protein